MSFFSPEQLAKCVRPPEFIDDPDCRHGDGIFVEFVSAEGAAIAALRCTRCGDILSTGSDG